MTDTYIRNLIQAIDFTKGLGASVSSFSINPTNSLLNEKNSAATFELIKKNGITSFKAAAGQCLKWSHALLPLISKAMECEVLLTIGQLHINGKEYTTRAKMTLSAGTRMDSRNQTSPAVPDSICTVGIPCQAEKYLT